MNAILNGLFGPSQVLHFLHVDLEHVLGGGLPPVPAPGLPGPANEAPPRQAADHARLDGDPWRPRS